MEEQLHKFNKREILNLTALGVNQSCSENAKEIFSHTRIQTGREVRKVPGSKCTSSKSRAALWQAHHKKICLTKKTMERRGRNRNSEKEKERRDKHRKRWVGVEGFRTFKKRKPSGSSLHDFSTANSPSELITFKQINLHLYFYAKKSFWTSSSCYQQDTFC